MLRYFIEVVQQQSFTRASERLFAVYAAQKAALLQLKAEKGDIVKPQDL